jgi:NADH-quinone oxidoreductase subunit N
MQIDASSLAIDLAQLGPEAVIALAAIAIILVDLVVSDKRVLPLISGVAVALAAVAAVTLWSAGGVSSFTSALVNPNDTIVVIDTFGIFFKLIILGTTFLVVLASPDYVRRLERWQGEYYALLLLAAAAMMLIVSVQELMTVFLAIEIQTFALVALTALLKDGRSSEAGLKFLLMGAVSTAMMLYGMALLFGLTGTTFLGGIGQGVGSIIQAGGVGDGLILVMAAVLLLAGFGFKISSVPFQMWVPDVYEGGPTPIAAFLSVASKAAGFAVLIRVFVVVFGEGGLDWLNWPVLIGVLAVASMTVGNVVAIAQTNLKRMLGYSTVAQAGYLLIGVAALTARGDQGFTLAMSGILFYLVAYGVTNLGAFIAIVGLANRAGGETIRDIAGLGRREPFMALALTLCLLSLTGLPPTAVFVGKIYVFFGAVQNGLWVLVLAGVLNSFVSAYYYLRPIRSMFVGATSSEEENIGIVVGRPSTSLRASLAVAMVGVILLGVFPPWVINRATEAATSLSP